MVKFYILIYWHWFCHTLRNDNAIYTCIRSNQCISYIIYWWTDTFLMTASDLSLKLCFPYILRFPDTIITGVHYRSYCDFTWCCAGGCLSCPEMSQTWPAPISRLWSVTRAVSLQLLIQLCSGIRYRGMTKTTSPLRAGWGKRNQNIFFRTTSLLERFGEI